MHLTQIFMMQRHSFQNSCLLTHHPLTLVSYYVSKDKLDWYKPAQLFFLLMKNIVNYSFRYTFLNKYSRKHLRLYCSDQCIQHHNLWVLNSNESNNLCEFGIRRVGNSFSLTRKVLLCFNKVYLLLYEPLTHLWIVSVLFPLD